MQFTFLPRGCGFVGNTKFRAECHQFQALVCTSCSNGVKDAVSAEIDVDCGGALCGKCIVGQDCGADSDCSTGKCDSGTN